MGYKDVHYDRSTYKLIDEQLKENFKQIVDAGNPKRIKGDINNDDTVNIVDIILLQKHLLNKEGLAAEQAEYADFNNDGLLNIFDLILMKRELVIK